MFNTKLQDAIESGDVELKPDFDSTPLETSLKGFGLYFPVFENLVNSKLSGKSAKRILITLFASKLENRKINLKRVEEVEVLKIANKLFEDILVIHLAALLEAEARKQQDLRDKDGKTESEKVLEQQLQTDGVTDVQSTETSGTSQSEVSNDASNVSTNS